MSHRNPKSVRRTIMEFLYQRYLQDPLDMVAPADFLETGSYVRSELLPNIHYLHDRGLIELMTGFNPPMFDAARISADGIDLVENSFEFNLRFPPAAGVAEEGVEDVPTLVEQLVEEADFAALDGEARRSLLRDVQYLRDELSRPVRRWREGVIMTVLEWIARYFDGTPDTLAYRDMLEARVREHFARHVEGR